MGSEMEDHWYEAPEQPECTDAEWQRVLQKGRLLLRMMLADDHAAGQLMTPPSSSARSAFQSYGDLSNNKYDKDTLVFRPSKRFGPALQAIGVHDSEISEVLPATRYYLDKSSEDGSTAIHAYFGLAEIVKHGVIFAISNYSPTRMVSLFDDESETVVPDLKYWSDVAFCHWHGSVLDENAMKGLKYVFRCGVQNFLSKSVIEKVLKRRNTDLRTWPGITIDANSEEGQALLGTPNGSGAAFLLIQHKQELGHKTIDQITIFLEKDIDKQWLWPSMVMHIKDV